jgi:hypothetical protein
LCYCCFGELIIAFQVLFASGRLVAQQTVGCDHPKACAFGFPQRVRRGGATTVALGITMRTMRLLIAVVATIGISVHAAEYTNAKAGELAAQVLSEGINSLDPQGILVWVDMPRSTPLNRDLTLVVTIENARASEPFQLESIDIASSFSRGFVLNSIDPKPSDIDEALGSMTLDYGLSIAPGEKLVISIDLKSKSPGVFVGDVDIWEGDRFLTRSAQCKVSR